MSNPILTDLAPGAVSYHAKRNTGKRLAYWVGFMEGALASGRVEHVEREALHAEAKKFVSFFDDPEAWDLLEDLSDSLAGDETSLMESLHAMVAVKRQELEEGGTLGEEAAEVSSFLGFCAGVMCDGVVSEEEVRAIDARLQRSQHLHTNVVFGGVRRVVQAVMKDGVVTPQEALEVQEWLAKLVGDGYADTGITSIGSVAVVEGMIHNPCEVCITGSHIVLTGTMRMGGRGFIRGQIARAGGVNEHSITRRTTMVVVGGSASPAWFSSHFGRKIETACKLIEEGHPLVLVSELAFEVALSRALSDQGDGYGEEEDGVMDQPVLATTTLKRGQNMPVEGVPTDLWVRWKGPAGVDGLDAIVFVLGCDRQVLAGESMVFFNQPVWGNGAVRLAQEGCGVHLDLARLDDAVETVVVSVVPQTVSDQPFSRLEGLEVGIDQNGGPIAMFPVEDAGEETAMIVVEIYRRNGAWKVRAVGQGFASGLLGLAQLYGVEVSDDEAGEPRDDQVVASDPNEGNSGMERPVRAERQEEGGTEDVAAQTPNKGGVQGPVPLDLFEPAPILTGEGVVVAQEGWDMLGGDGEACAPGSPLPEEDEDVAGPCVFPVALRRALGVMAQRPQDVLEDTATLAWARGTQERIMEALRDFGMEPRPAEPPLRVIPNGVLINFRGHANLTLPKVSKRESEFYTTYGINVADIRPGPGFVSFFVEREKRARISMAQAWLSATWSQTRPGVCTNLFVGVREDNAQDLFLNLDGEHEGYEEHAPHTLIAGETKSGKGVLTQSLLLQLIALNSPSEARLTLVDPKKGVDYGWIVGAPHLTGPIITCKEGASKALKELVVEMERRYALLQQAGSPNVGHYNRVVDPSRRLPRLYFVHDEIGGWMAESKGKAYAEVVAGSAARLGMEGRAAGIHLLLVTQRPDVQAVPGNLRDQMGNRLCLRVQRSDGSKMILNAQGGERLLGRGHIAVSLPGERPPGNAAFYVAQVPFAEPEDFVLLGGLAIAHWRGQSRL